MQWPILVFLCAILGSALSEPEPKKYKPEAKEENSSLTEDERNFLRVVETKFGIKSDDRLPTKENKTYRGSDDSKGKENKPLLAGVPGFPAVIAIEIVNDTDTKTKGKRTIDANLGYGYRTNSGYMYTYFGKSAQDKGKFMIYPYSQQDILPAHSSDYRDSSAEHSHPSATSNHRGSHNVVEIQPSQAFELVPVKEGEESGEAQYHKSVDTDTKYENIKSLESPPPPYPDLLNHHSPQATASPSTLYTTYNGQQFSSLQGQFPKVMSNYLVDPSQLLQNPQYQSAGLTKDHLRSHGQQLEQRVVPVLVLRIPSSYLKNPSAELYANLPQNYPLSQYLNNVNLQALVNQYFKKIGYPYAPQIMTYPNGAVDEPSHHHVASPVSQHEPQHYSNPYVRPSYTHADYSGVQYSAVQPVMAKYPTHTYSKQQYYIAQPQPQESQYEQHGHQQQYQYQYQYVQQPSLRLQQTPHYKVEQQYYTTQYQSPYHSSETQEKNISAEVQTPLQEVSSSVEPDVSQETNEEVPRAAVEYGLPNLQSANQHYATFNQGADYEIKTEYQMNYAPKELPAGNHQIHEQVTQAYPSAQVSTSNSYGQNKHNEQLYHNYAKNLLQSQHHVQRQPVQKETIAIYPSYSRHSAPKYSAPQHTTSDQKYLYHKTTHNEPESQSLIISENYPSKDHTHAMPYKYSKTRPSRPVQTVNYVTPLPFTAAKYQTQYKVMVPQTALKNAEKVSYVNSHSLPMHFLQSRLVPENYSEDQNTGSKQYESPVGSHTTSSYPKNYHSHPKRNTMSNENTTKEKNGSTDKKDPKKST